MPEEGPIYHRYIFDTDASASWVEEQWRTTDESNPIRDEWQVIDSGRSSVSADGDYSYFRYLPAMVELTPASPKDMGEFYLFAGGYGQLHYRLFGEYDDGEFRVCNTQPVTEGAFLWPGTSQVYEFPPSSYPGPELAILIERDTDMEWKSYGHFSDLDALNVWLRRMLRLDFRSVEYRNDNSYYKYLSNLSNADEKEAVERLIEEHPEWKVADHMIQLGVCQTRAGARLWKVEGLERAIWATFNGKLEFKVRARNSDQEVSGVKKDAEGVGNEIFADSPGRIFVGRTPITYMDWPSLPYVQNDKKGDSPVITFRSFYASVPRPHLGNRIRHSTPPVHASLIQPEELKIGDISVPDRFGSDTMLQWQRNAKAVWQANTRSSPMLRSLIQEAFYFVPMQVALHLRRSGRYFDALNWFRLVYDYQAEKGQRKNFFLKEQDQTGKNGYQPESSWLLDPIDPHEIAKTRGEAYTQFTLFSIIRCLIEYADDEFTRDTTESVSRARELYQSALNLLEDELGRLSQPCEKLSVKLKEKIRRAIGSNVGTPDNDAIGSSLARAVDRYNQSGKLRELETALKETDFDGESRSERIDRVSRAVSSVETEGTLSQTISQSFKQHTNAEKASFQTLLANNNVARSASLNAREVTSLAVGSNENGNRIYVTAKPTISLSFCIPPNPLLESLRRHASQNLTKIRNCQNIAGRHRELASYPTPTDAESAVLTRPSDLPTGSPNQSHLRPTQYRYDTLINRAKELVNLAQQFESQLLRLFEKRDQAKFRQLKAEQRGEIARARVNLQDQRLDKAEARVELAELQQERAQIQVGTYQQWLATGLNKWEQQMIGAYKRAGEARQSAAELKAAASAIQSLPALFSGGAASILAGAGLAASLGSTAYQTEAIRAQVKAQVASVRASHARRKQRWKLQEKLAQQDVRISAQRMDIAREQIDVVRGERRVAELQAEHANEISEFLANKFTSRELYEWMLEIIEGVYRTFLQQATAIASLAERQLAFERHERSQQIIESNYWQTPTEGRVQSQSDEGNRNRRGLTGSARLLQDIYQLDDYAFRTDERKQQVSKTISLAQLAPFELQQFRETGELTFDTARELFEGDYPGHHLRLIKSVSVSVIALTPPTDGIKAELSNSGISRVVTGGPPFRTKVIRRDPESITLSSPQNETGVFQLRPEGEMLLPFEKTGVDTSWKLRMLQAANAFDYDTIADVLLTINYTALQSETYRQQVIKRLDPEQSGQRAFSFSDEFADPWYDLHNPEQTDTPMTVQFETRRADFPPNLEDVEIDNVLLYYVTEDDVDAKELKTTLKLTPQDGQGTVGGQATPVEQRVSTRRGNGSSWIPMIGKAPTGEWELSLPETPKVKRLFEEEKVEDILFVITYKGRTPEWPA